MSEENKTNESSILEKIRKFLQVTTKNGATEAEMETALKMAQQLMMRHNIDESHIDISPLDINITDVEEMVKNYETKYWLWDLLQIIGIAYSCEITRAHSKNHHYYRIIGTNEDRAIVKEIFITILPVIRNLNIQRYKEYCKMKKANWEKIYSKRIFTGSYVNGFMSGLSIKLQEDRDTFLQTNSDKDKWGLIVVKKTEMVEKYVAETLKPKEVKVKGSQGIIKSVYELGEQDGLEKNGNKLISA